MYTHTETYSFKAFHNWCAQPHMQFQVHTHTNRHTCHKGSERRKLKLLSDTQSKLDPGNTKGHDKHPLDFSAVLFPRHTLTHRLSVTSQTRPWHLGHLSAAGSSFSDRLTWHRVVWHRWHSDQEVCSLCCDLSHECSCHISLLLLLLYAPL